MMSLQDKLQVEAIRNGTVIDHIPSPLGFDILRFLKLENSNERMTVGINLPSSNMKTKDIIKIENVFLPENKANQLALFSQNITINQKEIEMIIDSRIDEKLVQNSRKLENFEKNFNEKIEKIEKNNENSRRDDNEGTLKLIKERINR